MIITNKTGYTIELIYSTLLIIDALILLSGDIILTCLDAVFFFQKYDTYYHVTFGYVNTEAWQRN